MTLAKEAICTEVKITLDEAIKLALKNGPGLKPAKTMVKSAEESKKKAFASYFPVYSFELRGLYYSEEPGIGGEMGLDIGTPPQPANDFDLWLLSTLAGLSDTFSSFKSEKYDVNITLTIKQPITPLYQVYYANKLAELNIDASKIQVIKTERDLIYKVKETFFSILKLKDAVKALDEGISSVSAHVQKAELFYEQKLITKNDLLQAKARLAEMESSRISLQSNLEFLNEVLNSIIGLKPGTKLEIENPDLTFSNNIPTFESAMQVAEENRPELKELKTRVKMAEASKKMTLGSFIPQIAVFGSYTHNEGSVMKYPPFSVGGIVSWDFWDFGSRYFDYRSSKYQYEAANEGLEDMEKAIAIEIQEAISKIKSAQMTMEKALASVLASEEQLRIEKERYAQNITTSTEVLDAQTRLTQAQVQKASALYDIFIGLAKLEKATGREWK